MFVSAYYYITDAELSKAGNVSNVKSAIECGVKIVQYRNKKGTTKDLFAEAMKLRDLCINTKTKFIVDDRIDIALAVDADGVHIGQEDMPYETARRLLGKDKIIGVTVHNVSQAIDAEKKGANYLGVSPIFYTATKPDAGKPSGIKLIKEIKTVCKTKIVAIGGIKLSNVQPVIDAGADCICSISDVICKDNVKEQIIKFQKRYNQNDTN